jgi:hypothetical protein
MRDGLYRLTYAGAASSAVGMFALRNKAFSGVGEKGAFYQGTCVRDPARNLYSFKGSVTFRPDTPTVTGYVASPEGSTIALSGELSEPAPRTRFSLDFAGRTVDVLIEYIGPLPG